MAAKLAELTVEGEGPERRILERHGARELFGEGLERWVLRWPIDLDDLSLESPMGALEGPNVKGHGGVLTHRCECVVELGVGEPWLKEIEALRSDRGLAVPAPTVDADAEGHPFRWIAPHSTTGGGSDHVNHLRVREVDWLVAAAVPASQHQQGN